MKTEADIIGSTKVGTFEVVYYGEVKIAEKHTHPDITDEMWLIDGEFEQRELIDKIIGEIKK